MRTMKTLIAIAVAAAFSLPFAAQAAGDKASSASSSGAAGSASSGATSSGAEKMFQAMDKNKDSSISKEEAKGTPHDKDVATLDKNKDGKLSREEHAAAPEHAGDKASSPSTGATSGGASKSQGSKY